MYRTILTALLLTVATVFVAPLGASAHCDGLDGPVVNDARRALDTNRVDLVLRWVQPRDAREIREAFSHARTVRELSPEARSLADRYFFETLVRVHRAGEGAPYTGLKPAGRDLGPAIPAADRAIETGSTRRVQHLLARAVHHGLAERWRHVRSLRRVADRSVEDGRAYVAAYVELVHYVERVYQAASGAGHHDPGAEGPEPGTPEARAHARH